MKIRIKRRIWITIMPPKMLVQTFQSIGTTIVSNEDISSHRLFNQWYQDASFPICWDISPTVLNIFNPYIYLVRPLFLWLVNPYIEDVSIRIQPFFTGNKCDNCQIKNVYIYSRANVVCLLKCYITTHRTKQKLYKRVLIVVHR